MDYVQREAIERAKDMLNFAQPTAQPRIGLSKRESKRWSLFKAISILRPGALNSALAREGAAFELECSNAVAKSLGRELSSNIFVPSEVVEQPLDRAAAMRALSTQPGAKGGYLVNVRIWVLSTFSEIVPSRWPWVRA